MKMTIEVTRNDLKGKYTNSLDCPIARALKRTFNANKVFVFRDNVHILDINSIDFNNKVYKLPEYADEQANIRSNNWWYRLLIGGFKFELED